MSDHEIDHHDLHIQIVQLEGRVDTHLAEINGNMKVIREKVEAAVDTGVEHRQNTVAALDDHAERIGGLEKTRNILVGAYFALVIAWGAVETFFTGHNGPSS